MIVNLNSLIENLTNELTDCQIETITYQKILLTKHKEYKVNPFDSVGLSYKKR